VSGFAEGEGERRVPQDIAPQQPLIEIPGCDPEVVRAIQDQFGLSAPAAETLVRRGVTEPDQVAASLEDVAPHPPEELPGAAAGAAVIAAHIERGSRIAVHGDYDVDGVCSTAILVRALAGRGADVTWHVPSRFEDGYGLTLASVERLAADGVELIVAVDCGIGSVAEVERACELGIEVVVCDHHTIGETLPAATIVHPGLGGYPDPGLCAAAATHKLAACVVAQAGADGSELERDLALVALATVCDMVPLTGENRALVRRGLAQMRKTQRPGLIELMRVAGVDQLKVSASSFGFGLGPRINAAGRMHSAEPAVELMLTENAARASELAGKLASANQLRREIERDVSLAAERQAAEQADQYAIVVAGEDWHPGVLGIVAGRIADRYRRPAVALTIAGDIASGSGRSGGVHDLHGGLASCAELLDRFGGHRAAAGLALAADRIPAFRAALARHAAATLTIDDLRPRLRVDAVIGPEQVTIENVEGLEALGPFGAANPAPLMLLAGVTLEGVAKLGGSGQHFKLTVASQAARTPVVAFRQERAIVAQSPPRRADLVVELQRNEFKGREEAQAVLRAILQHDQDQPALWREEFGRAASDAPVAGGSTGLDPEKSHDRRNRPLLELLHEFAGEQQSLAIVANDPVPLREQLGGAFAEVVFAYDDPRLSAGGFSHVLMAEPPPAPAFADFGDAEAILAWDDRGLDPSDVLLSRDHVVATYRVVRGLSAPIDAALAELRSQCPNARIAGRALRVLEEIGVVEITRDDRDVTGVSVRDVGKVELDQSVTFRSYSEYREGSSLWLRQLSEQTQSP
jgi:single-stranded-DNA-specific exonuclease